MCLSSYFLIVWYVTSFQTVASPVCQIRSALPLSSSSFLIRKGFVPLRLLSKTPLPRGEHVKKATTALCCRTNITLIQLRTQLLRSLSGSYVLKPRPSSFCINYELLSKLRQALANQSLHLLGLDRRHCITEKSVCADAAAVMMTRTTLCLQHDDKPIPNGKGRRFESTPGLRSSIFKNVRSLRKVDKAGK